MGGNGTIGGRGSCDVEFTVNGKRITARDPSAGPGRTKIHVTFPKETDICSGAAHGNKVVVTLEEGDTVDIRWN